uniref:Uncharacterized protein n=1 Tax=Arundo donax TaxID=35708 RepID=A0A0A9FD43_ARUDO
MYDLKRSLLLVLIWVQTNLGSLFHDADCTFIYAWLNICFLCCFHVLICGFLRGSREVDR